MSLSSAQRRAYVDNFVIRMAAASIVTQAYVDNAVASEASIRAQQVGFVKDNSDPAAIDSLVEVIQKVNNDKTDVLSILATKADNATVQATQASLVVLTERVDTNEADLEYVIQNLPQ